MDKRFWAIISIIVVLFGGVVFVNNHKKDSETNNKVKTAATEHVKGKLDSKVTVIEYGDFQCSACEQLHTVVSATQAKFSDRVKFQFRHLPLVQLHPNAFAASRAAEAAGIQGKFWEMYELLYDQTRWADWTTSKTPDALFKSYAKSLGLDTEKFAKDFSSSTVNTKINADIDTFKKTGQALATPAFFINGKYIDNNQLYDANGPSVDAFSKVLDDSLKSAK